MALSRSPLCALPFALLALPSLISAQDDRGQADVVAGSRVVRCLKALEKAGNYSFEGAMLQSPGGRNVIIMGGPGGQAKPPKPKPILIQGIRTGPLVYWSRQGGKEILAQHGGRWAQIDRDGQWIPVRGPQGSWKNQQFTDPGFLAGRLRDINDKIQWQILSGVTIDERPVRCYESTISEKDARLLFRSGALPAGGSMGGLGQIIMLGAAGRNLKMPETMRKVHIKIFEDPRTHLPVKIECEIFAKQDRNGAVQIAFGGPGAGPTDEEEEEGEKKPKPTYTFTLTFDKYGKTTPDALDGQARKLLGVKAATAEVSPGNAGKSPENPAPGDRKD